MDTYKFDWLVRKAYPLLAFDLCLEVPAPMPPRPAADSRADSDLEDLLRCPAHSPVAEDLSEFEQVVNFQHAWLNMVEFLFFMPESIKFNILVAIYQ